MVEYCVPVQGRYMVKDQKYYVDTGVRCSFLVPSTRHQKTPSQAASPNSPPDKEFDHPDRGAILRATLLQCLFKCYIHEHAARARLPDTGNMETTGTAATATTSASVFFLPYPGAQGHTNPMLQFGRRLAYHGLRPTLVVTRYVLSTTEPPSDPFRVAAISDGFDAGGMASCPDVAEYLTRMEAAGSETLRELLQSEAKTS